MMHCTDLKWKGTANVPSLPLSSIAKLRPTRDYVNEVQKTSDIDVARVCDI